MSSMSMSHPALRVSRTADQHNTGQLLRRQRGYLAERRAQLEAHWRDRLERITALSVAYYEASQNWDTSRAGRVSRTRLLARQVAAERHALAEIEAALGRISAGQYGICEECGRPIAATVLTALPQARYCGGCDRRQAPLRQRGAATSRGHR